MLRHKKIKLIAGILCLALTAAATSCVVVPPVSSNFHLAAMADPVGIYGNLFGNGEVIEVEVELQDTEWGALSEEPSKAVITVNGSTLYDVGVSLDDTGGRYLVKTDAFEAGQNFKGLDILTFSSSECDPSYMRQLLGYSAWLTLGGMTPYLSYAAIRVNGEMQGLYLMSEGVGKKFIERNSAMAEDTTLYYAAQPGCTLEVSDSAEGFEVRYGSDPEMVNIKRLITTLNTVSVSDIKTLEEILDVDSVLKAAAVSYVTGSGYGYGSIDANDYFLLYTKGKFIYVNSPGSESFGISDDGSTLSSPVNTDELSERPLFDRLLAVPEYYNKYVGYVFTLVNYFKNINSMVENIAVVIRNYAASGADTKYSREQFDLSVAATDNSVNDGQSDTTGATEVDVQPIHDLPKSNNSVVSIIAYMENRLANIKSELPETTGK